MPFDLTPAKICCEQENDSKTARAEKKATEEIKLREQKEKEIQELQFQVTSKHPRILLCPAALSWQCHGANTARLHFRAEG